MKVCDLLRILASMPLDHEVMAVYDGAARTEVAHAWIARGGYICLAAKSEFVYHDADRPAYAPTEAENPNWTTP